MDVQAASLPYSDSESTLQNETLFRQLALTHQRHALDAGIELVPYRDPLLPLFRSQSDVQKKQVLAALGTFVKICTANEAAGHKMSDSPALIWRFLMEHGLRPPSDLFSFIQPSSVIEIHTLEGIQIFRNFNFYRYCSYTLEELYCQPWDLLFERTDVPTEAIVDFVTKCVTGEIRNTVRTHIPAHIVSELYSTQENVVALNMEFAAPLFDERTSRVAATVSIETITPMADHDKPAKRTLKPLVSIRESLNIQA